MEFQIAKPEAVNVYKISPVPISKMNKYRPLAFCHPIFHYLKFILIL